MVKKAQGGDSQAFGALYDQLADRIYRFIKIKVQNRQQAEDLLQETFIKVWRHLNQFFPEGGTFQAWVYKIALNSVNDHFRKIYRKPETLELNENIDKASGENLESEVADRIETEKVLRTFDLLDGNYRLVLQLRFGEDMSVEETAKILNKSKLAIRVIQHRALAKLRKLIKDNDVLGHSKI